MHYICTMKERQTYSLCTPNEQLWHDVCSTASNQLKQHTMRKTMTFVMTLMQAASVSIGLIYNELANVSAILFLLSTAGVWAAQALDNN